MSLLYEIYYIGGVAGDLHYPLTPPLRKDFSKNSGGSTIEYTYTTEEDLEQDGIQNSDRQLFLYLARTGDGSRDASLSFHNLFDR